MYVGDYLITSLETITGFGVVDGSYIFTLDELQSASIANTEETTDITGKAGRKLAKLKKNKGATVSANNGMLSGGLLEAQTGGTFENKTTEVMWTDYLTVDSNHSATTQYTAIANNGAGTEIISLYLKKDGVVTTGLVQSDTAKAAVPAQPSANPPVAGSPQTFTYNPTTKVLGFDDGVAEGTEIVVCYKRNIQADVLSNDSDSFAIKCQLYVDALGEDKCGNIYRIQIYFPKADVSGEFSFDLGDNQTVHAFEAEALAGACGAGANLWTYTVFGVNTADAT